MSIETKATACCDNPLCGAQGPGVLESLTLRDDGTSHDAQLTQAGWGAVIVEGKSLGRKWWGPRCLKEHGLAP